MIKVTSTRDIPDADAVKVWMSKEWLTERC